MSRADGENRLFAALADPTRRRILQVLRGGERTAGEIAALFPQRQPTVSHHLGVLRAANLVWDERRGQSVVYGLNTTVLQEVLGWVLDVAGMGGKDREPR